LLVEMKHITKRYGEVIANDDVSLALEENEILAIVGENGAGKTTIMKILYGLEHPDAGEIFIRGQKVLITSPRAAMAHHIGMVQQHFMLFDTLSAAENIVYQNEIRKGIFFDHKKTNQTVLELSQSYGLPIDPQAIVQQLPIGSQQRVEILKILYQQSQIIIFDEPSAVLTPLEVEELLKTMKQLKAMGKSLILITHKLQEVMDVADRVIVMRQGKVTFESKVTDTNVKELTYHMVKRHLNTRTLKPQNPGEVQLELKHISVYGNSAKKELDDISLCVRSFEIVGIAGVSGNGQSLLARVISGLLDSDAGELFIKGQNLTHQSVHSIRQAGLSHVPDDRYLWGSAREATLGENALMGFEYRPDFTQKGILKSQKIKHLTNSLIDRYQIKADDWQQKMSQLSGGNAQKLVVGREFEQNSEVLLVNEPTRGIDIGAMEFIHQQLVEKRDNGCAILLISSDLNEIMTLSDRIIVLFEGRINATFVRGEADARQLGLYMVKRYEEIET